MSESGAHDRGNAELEPIRGDLSRRALTLRAGGGLALAALALGFGSPVLAQEATPDPDGGLAPEGGYGVIRVRTLRADRSSDELVALVREGFVPLLRDVPGFVSYAILWNAETRDWAAISVFADKAGADESNALAGAWGAESGAVEYTEGDPIVVEGTVAIAAEA